MKGTINQNVPRIHPDNYTDRDLKIGDTVYLFTGYTYGCISPDAVAISFNLDSNPFFQIDEKWVDWEKQ